MSFYKNSIYRGENVITEIIFSDCYRTFLLCAFPIILAFAMRNANTKNRVFAIVGYGFIMLILFFWIFFVCIIFTEFNYESIIAIAKWGIKWILYFTTSTILQFVMYSILWGENRRLKVVTLLLNILIITVPLCVFNFG